MNELSAPQASDAAKARPYRRVEALKRWWLREIGTGIEHEAILGKVHAEGGFTTRYAFMVLMSAGIAILGLLLSSPAVVIGAMLVSPLMGPIIGLGFALATFDWDEVRSSLFAVAAGSLLAIGFAALIVLLSPLKDLTPELLARTRPNLFDLLVATFSALAGAYATVRGRGETIVGVAIATALMPPLATVGFGLATANGIVFFGSLGLFLTNLIAITLSAAAMARLYGFGAHLSPDQTRKQTWWLIGVFVALSIPLAFSLRQIAWEAWATQTARTTIAREFGPQTRITTLEPDFRGDSPAFRAVVVSDEYRLEADARIRDSLRQTLGGPVEVSISQLTVARGTSQTELQRVAAGAAATAAIREQIAAIAGVSPEDVLLDQTARRARVAVSGDLPLSAWADLETRIDERLPGWDVQFAPPLQSLPPIGFAEVSAELSVRAADEVDRAGWALARWGVSEVEVIGRAASNEPDAADLALARAETVAERLRLSGVQAQPRADAPGPVQRAREAEEGRAAFRSVRIALSAG
ncbi:MAG: DUF389 domain-containing protein [Thermaurantiacus sp.]